MLKLSLSIYLLGLLVAVTYGQTNIVCYYDSKAATLASPILPANISTANCTHLIYIGIGLNANGTIRLLNENFDVNNNGFTSFTSLRANFGSKVLIQLGGQYETSAMFSNVIGSKPDVLIGNIALFLDRYSFDGIDIDWRYPSVTGGRPADKANYATFLNKLRSRLAMVRKMLSISVSPNKAIFTSAYDVAKISLYTDMINVLSFNFTAETKTAYVAPLFKAATDLTAPANVQNVNSSVLEWLAFGVRRSKINLAIATFAKGYVLSNANNNAVGSAFSKLSPPGPNTNTTGYMGYYEFCSSISNYTINNDTTQGVSYYTQGTSWVSAEDTNAIVEKLSFIVSNRLAGAAIYTLDWDDVNNTCGEGANRAVGLAQQYILNNFPGL